MVKEIFITWGYGQLWPEVLKPLINLWIPPHLINLLVRNKDRAMGTLEKLWLPHREFQYTVGDITNDMSKLRAQIPKNIWQILNMAGSVKFAESERQDVTNINLNWAINMAQIAKDLWVPFSHVSTAYILGRSDDTIPEDWLTEEYSRNPKNPYEQVKWEAEEEIRRIFDWSPLVKIIRAGILTDWKRRPDIAIPHATMWYFLPFIMLRNRLNERGKNEIIDLEGFQLCWIADTEINIVDNAQAGSVIADIITHWHKTPQVTNLVNRKAPSYIDLTSWVLTELGFTGYKIWDKVIKNKFPQHQAVIPLSRAERWKVLARLLTGWYKEITIKNYLDYVTHTSHFEWWIDTDNQRLAIDATRALMPEDWRLDTK